MGVARTMPDLELWLDVHATAWSILVDREYKDLVRRWTTVFSPLVASGAQCLQGSRAILSLEARLPAQVYLLSGIEVPQLANMGGQGPTAYRVNGLRGMSRDLANRLELILVAADFAWSWVFSHEAGAFEWEQMYEASDIMRTKES